MRNKLKDFNKSDQDLLIKYANERNIKFSTVAGYVSTWKKYTKLNNMSITEKDTQDIYEDTYSLENGKYI